MMRPCKTILIIVALLATGLATNAYSQKTASTDQSAADEQQMKSVIEPAISAVKEPEYPRPLSSAEMAEREWLARQEATRTAFIVFVIGAVAFLAMLHILPHLVARRKLRASKVASHDQSGTS